MIRPEVTPCCWRDVKILELTNQPKAPVIWGLLYTGIAVHSTTKSLFSTPTPPVQNYFELRFDLLHTLFTDQPAIQGYFQLQFDLLPTVFTSQPTVQSYFQLRFDLLYTLFPTVQGHFELQFYLLHSVIHKPRLSWTTIWHTAHSNSVFTPQAKAILNYNLTHCIQ